MPAKKLIPLNFNGNIDESLLLKCKLKEFPCGEFEFSIQEEIGNYDIEIYQSFEVGKFNDDLMKLQIVCDVLKRNNAKSISYFAPFLPYTRQDKANKPDVSFGAKMVAEIINSCGIGKIQTYDLHNPQIESFFTGNIANISAIPLFLENIEKNFNKKEVIIVFPDAGAYNRFKKFINEEDYCKIVIISKTRTESGLKMEISGNILNKTAVIIDDMIDSGGTIIEASKLLKQNSTKQIFAYATHGLLSGNAVEKLTNTSEIEKITITNSLIQKQILNDKFTVLDCGMKYKS